MYSGDIRLQHLSLREVHPTRRLLDRGGDEVLLEGGEGNRATGFEREDVGNLGAAPLHDLHGLEEDLGAFRGCRLRPCRKGFCGGCNGDPGLLTAAGGDSRKQSAIVWAVHVEDPIAAGAPPLPTGKVFVDLDSTNLS